MWNRPWSFKEGFVIGCGLCATSLMLQLVAGQINWELTAWPVNAVLLALIVLIIVAMHLMRKKVYVFAWLSSYTCAISAMSFAVGVTILLGLIAQAPAYDTDVSCIKLSAVGSDYECAYV